jgi:hypothetical protein
VTGSRKAKALLARTISHAASHEPEHPMNLRAARIWRGLSAIMLHECIGETMWNR